MITKKWIYCPICRNKTRTKIRKDTELINYPLFCPKCKQESLSLRPFYDEHGNMYIVVDMELKGRVRAALIKAILGFEVRVK